DTDVMRQLAVVGEDLRNRQLAPIGLEVLAAAAEFALPAVVLCQDGRGVEEQVGEILQRGQIGQAPTANLLGGELGDRGEARVNVIDDTVTVHQDEGAGALLDGALEQ